jgi:SAM-dependent methyltransferase
VISTAREQSYGQYGTTFVDRLRTRLVEASIQRRIPRRSDLRALDLGCGYYAGYLRAIESRLASGVGVDFEINPETLKRPKLRFVTDSVERALPKLEERSFDVVLFISVLEHVWNPQECLSHCHRVLAEGGRLLINVPTWYAKPVLELFAFRLGWSPAIEMDDHKMYYSKRDLWPLLVGAGFKPSRIRMSYERLGMTLFATAERGAE